MLFVGGLIIGFIVGGFTAGDVMGALISLYFKIGGARVDKEIEEWIKTK